MLDRKRLATLGPPPTPQGYKPRVWLHRAADWQLLATIAPKAELGVSALALSFDHNFLAISSAAPDNALSIWDWKQVLRL